MPCYNDAKTIGGCLRSVLRQQTLDGGNADVGEIVVYDDGSDDDSAHVVRSFESSGVRLIEGGENRGGNVARQALLEASGGDWLQFLDADDALPPQKLSRQLHVGFESSADVVYSSPIQVPGSDDWWRDIDAGREPSIWPTDGSFPKQMAGTPEADSAADPWSDFLAWRRFQTSSVLWRRQTLLEVGGWKLDQPRCQEHELLLRLLRNDAKVVHVPDSGAVYRVDLQHSVSRRDPMATVWMRTSLVREAAAFLQPTDGWNASRRSAMQKSLLEAARSSYRHDRPFASQCFADAGRLAAMTADRADALPWHFRMTALAMGFAAAERLASWRRR